MVIQAIEEEAKASPEKQSYDLGYLQGYLLFVILEGAATDAALSELHVAKMIAKLEKKFPNLKGAFRKLMKDNRGSFPIDGKPLDPVPDVDLPDPKLKRKVDAAEQANNLNDVKKAEAECVLEQTKKLAPNKVPTPSVKGIGKVADAVPTHVPKNWSKVDIEDAISTYEGSIKLRKAEAEAFDAVGGGHVWARKAHYERIAQEENFLRQLQRRFEDLR